MASKFIDLLSLNVNDKTEKRKAGNQELTYLSWAWAWAEFKKVYPDATYKVKTFDYTLPNGVVTQLPYMEDMSTGYMVMTEVTADGLTHSMWLPVMDCNNKAMKSIGYKYQTRYGDKTVEACSMFDINKTIMRCLVKNLAMFGLGLYIYAGEDLPEVDIATKEDIVNTFGGKEIKDSPEDRIAACKSVDELKAYYQSNKAELAKDSRILNLITQKKKELTEAA